MKKTFTFSLPENRYRIVSDRHYYVVQVRFWWWPFWIECEMANLHGTIDEARAYAKRHKEGFVVEYVDNPEP